MTNKTTLLNVPDENLPFSKFVEEPDLLLTVKSPVVKEHQRRFSVRPIDPTLCPKSLEVIKNKVHDKKKGKKLIRNAEVSCDHPLRAKLWLQLANLLGGNMHRADAYDEVLKAVYGDEVEPFQDGEKIPPKSYPQFTDPRFTTINHHLNTEGIHSTHRILAVIAFERPDITYAPTLPSLTSTLLHYLTEDQVYHLLGTLLSRTAQERYITQTRIAYQASSAVFKKLALKYFKSACTHLRKAGHNIDNVFTDWVFWIFKHLPFNHLVRVIDCYLYEGPKILYRVALAILHHFDKNKHEKCIEDYCGRIDVCPKTLLKTSFNIRGLSRNQMFELMSKREMEMTTRDSVFGKQAFTSNSSGSLHVPTNTNSKLVTRNESEMESKGGQVGRRDGEEGGEGGERGGGGGEGGGGGKGGMDVSHMYTAVKSEVLSREEVVEGVEGGWWRHIYEWLPNRVTLKRPHLIFSTAEHGTSLLTFYKLVEGHDPTLLVLKSTTGEMIGAYLAGDWQDRRGGSRSKFFGTGESFVCQFNPTPVKFSWVGIAGGDNGRTLGQVERKVEVEEGGEVKEEEEEGGGGGSIQPIIGGFEDGDPNHPPTPLSNPTNHALNPLSNPNNHALNPHKITPNPHSTTSMFATGDATSISIGGGNGQAIQLDSNLLEGSTTHCSTFNNPPLIPSTYFQVSTLEVFAFE